jgi:hypothetical protein
MGSLWSCCYPIDFAVFAAWWFRIQYLEKQAHRTEVTINGLSHFLKLNHHGITTNDYLIQRKVIMKRILVALATLATITAMAEGTDKSEYCPSVSQVRIIRRGEPNLYIYRAVNSEGKLFESALYGGNRNNGPAPALGLAGAEYNEATKELTCTYTAYSLYGRPVLVNKGDY